MRSFYLCILSTFLCTALLAQTKKSTCKVERTISKTPITGDQENLIIKFVGPSKQPVKSHVKMQVDAETVFPEMNDKGIYVDHLEPGTYKFTFSVPYWFDAVIEKLKCNKNEIISITVYFEAQRI